MMMRNTIRRILRESIQKSRYVLRRVKSLDTKNLIDLLKKQSIDEMNRNNSIEDAIESASHSVAIELTPWHDENGYEFPEKDYNEATTYFGQYLQETFGNEIREYLQKVLPESSFNEDEFNYIFWKHSEVNGGSGFSEEYPSWGKLIIGIGWWFPINWWEIKEKLDGRSQLTFMKPGDEHNNFGYYFSIIKERKNLNESVIRILREEDFVPLEDLNTVIKDHEYGFDVFIMNGDKKVGEISFAKENIPNLYTIVDATMDDKYKGNRIYPKTIINLFKERPNIIINSLFRSPEAEKAWRYILSNLPSNIGKSVKYYKDEDTTLYQLKLRNIQEHIKKVLREETEKITCEECGWSWKLSEGGEDPYTCHKCGNDNEKSDLIVFHGTPEKHEFNKEGYLFNGTFFSTDKNEAKSFGEYVYKVKLNPNLDLFDTNKLEDCEDIVNSFDLIDPYYDEDEEGYYIETPEQLWDNEDSWSPLERTPGVIEYLNRNYDGVWIYEGGVRNLLLFKPIKDKIEYVKLI